MQNRYVDLRGPVMLCQPFQPASQTGRPPRQATHQPTLPPQKELYIINYRRIGGRSRLHLSSSESLERLDHRSALPWCLESWDSCGQLDVDHQVFETRRFRNLLQEASSPRPCAQGPEWGCSLLARQFVISRDFSLATSNQWIW